MALLNNICYAILIPGMFSNLQDSLISVPASTVRTSVSFVSKVKPSPGEPAQSSSKFKDKIDRTLG